MFLGVSVLRHWLAAQRIISLTVDLDGCPSRLAHLRTFLFAYG